MNYTRSKTVFVILQTILIALALFSNVRAAGEVDPTFNGGAFIQPIRRVFVIKRQPDGKILVGGDFEVANGALRNGIARLNADSTVDTTFNPPDTLQGMIRAIEIQPDGKILIGGNFVIPLLTNWTVVARLNADDLSRHCGRPEYGQRHCPRRRRQGFYRGKFYLQYANERVENEIRAAERRRHHRRGV